MKYLLIGVMLLLAPPNGFSQSMSGTELLDKTIAYHDPNGNWTDFNGSLSLELKRADNSVGTSEVTINLAEEYFDVQIERDDNITGYTVSKGDCSISFNGKTNPSEEILKEHKLSCERAYLYKNYYTYLYGLPMKLKDPGTHIHPKVALQTFKGKVYLVLKATYDEAVGKDVWFFYFDPKTYAMEVYQFFKGDPKAEGKDTGEYILLSEESMVNGIKMPAVRAWYYNKNNEYLGTDRLKTR
ncbi:MAG: DUF6503 family protein [Bacteroidota bacterium]